MAASAEVRKLVGLATDIVHRLQRDGHEAYFVGGAVRDVLLGRAFTEIDITTSAEPRHIRRLFRRTLLLGEAFGVIAVMRKGIPFEVATFRSETGYTDGRHPDEVTIGTLEDDVQRRDFTINGLVLDPGRGVVMDLVGGVSDLQKRLLRAIGDPVARMNEDYLRTVRAVRFAACLEVEMEPATQAAVRGAAAGLDRISRERIHHELAKVCLHRAAPRGLRLMGECGVAAAIFGPPVRDEHMADASRLVAALTDPPGLPELLAATTLAAAGAALLREAAGPGAVQRARHQSERLRLSNVERKQLAELFSLLGRLEKLPEVRLGERAESYRLAGFEAALQLEKARRLLQGEGTEALDEMWAEYQSLSPERLAGQSPVTGRDLKQLGVAAGPEMGAALKELSYLFVEGKISSRDEAMRWLEDLVQSS